MWVGVTSPIATIRTALDLIELAPTDTLLDLGCGDGRCDQQGAFTLKRTQCSPAKTENAPIFPNLVLH